MFSSHPHLKKYEDINSNFGKPNVIYHKMIISISDNMAASYSQQRLSDEDFSNYSEPDNLSATVLEHRRWKKKTVKARILIGVLTVICCILIVILIITYESGRKRDVCHVQTVERPASDNVMKFIHLSDIHYDPFYDKTISKTSFCRPQGGSNNTAKYIAEYGRIGCDSPASLFENSLDAIKNVSRVEDVSFILLTGK